MAMRLNTAQDTHTGLKRQVNEDYLGSRIPEANSPEAEYGALFVVADGVGSLGNGDVASRVAVETMLRVYYAAETSAETIYDRIRQAVIAAHEAVREEAAKRDKERLGTTIVGMVVLPDGDGWTFNVGDSRVYEVSEGLRQITVDDAKTGGSNAPLSAFLGQTSKELVVEPKPLLLENKQIFLICTDGLWKVVDRETVVTTVRRYSAKQATRKLIDATLNGGAPDNVTVTIVRIGRPPVPIGFWYTLATILLLVLLTGGFFAAGGPDLLDSDDGTSVAVAVAEETEEAGNSGISVEPTATTDATVTSVATATPEPTATIPIETSVPTDTPTPSETLTATSTQTPVPTASPEPTVTDLPSATPIPSITPTITPTNTPLPTSTPLPTVTPSPTLQPTFTSQPTITPRETATLRPTDTLEPTVTLDPNVITSTPDPNELTSTHIPQFQERLLRFLRVHYVLLKPLFGVKLRFKS
jgi:serine/threonine protein phosphatase PrpC